MEDRDTTQDAVERCFVRICEAISRLDLLFAECANILWKKVRRGELTKEEAAIAAQTLEAAD